MSSTAAAVPRQISVRSPRQPSPLEEAIATFSSAGRPSCEDAEGSSATSSTAWLVDEYRRIRRRQILRRGAERTLYVLKKGASFGFTHDSQQAVRI